MACFSFWRRAWHMICQLEKRNRGPSKCDRYLRAAASIRAPVSHNSDGCDFAIEVVFFSEARPERLISIKRRGVYAFDSLGYSVSPTSEFSFRERASNLRFSR